MLDFLGFTSACWHLSIQHSSIWGLTSIKKKEIIVLPCPPIQHYCYFITESELLFHSQQQSKQEPNFKNVKIWHDPVLLQIWITQSLRWPWQCTFGNKIKNCMNVFSRKKCETIQWQVLFTRKVEFCWLSYTVS